MSKASKIFKLILAVAVCQGAGLAGSLFTAPAIEGWYASLEKPSFNPPNWVFAPVWTMLFLLMGVSLYLVWSRQAESRGVMGKKKRTALLIFAVQLALNIFWSILFFGLQAPMYAFVEIIILWLAIFLTVVSFFRISKLAAYLLLPYILWVSFAVVLNYSLMI